MTKRKRKGNGYALVDDEPYRLLVEFTAGVMREVATEIEVAADRLMVAGWPFDRFRLYVDQRGDVTKTQLVLTKGVELADDTPVFEVREEKPRLIGGHGLSSQVEATATISVRYAGYWLVDPTSLKHAASP